MWVWDVVKSAILWLLIHYPVWVMLTSSLSQNAPAISSLNMSIAASGSPLTLWPRGVGGRVSLCCPLAHVFSKCVFGVRPVSPFADLYLSSSLGTEEYSILVMGGGIVWLYCIADKVA
jgi:hypothetical protein